MSDRKKDLLWNLAVGAVIAVLVYLLDTSRGNAFLHSLCDGTFVAAVMLLGIGGIKGIRNKGAFDVMGFGVKSTVETFLPFLQRGEKEDPIAYRERKEAERKPAGGMLIAGIVYFVVSVIVLVFYQIFN